MDDLIMNTLGTLVGYLLYRLFAVAAKRDINIQKHRRFEPELYLGAMLAGRFLLYNEMGLVRILYDL